MPKTTVAKFKCVSVDQRERDVRYVSFMADTSASNDWSKWTPSGDIKICVTNPDCEFNVGKIYLVTLEELS